MATVDMKQRELTGKHVLIMLVAFFGILIAVNIYFAYAAVTSFRGEDVKGSYRQGLEYNQTIAARAEQKALGWTVKANLLTEDDNENALLVLFNDASENPINGLSIEGILRHPTDLQQDKPITFLPLGYGRYEAAINDVSGQWKLRARAKKGEESFLFEHDIIVE